jgi:hypothetical protein
MVGQNRITTFEGRTLKNKIISLALIAGLAACSGGNPFEEEEVVDPDTAVTGETDGNGITVDGIPPGTESPSAGSTIFRTEEQTDDGDGYANSVSYNSADDTFTVDNLAFDGDSPYVRGTDVSSLNGGRFAVYEAEQLANDPVTGAPIDQFTYRAIYGVSKNRTDGDDPVATTQFAIIRTGNYIPYGFGGFIYQRDESVTLPSRLQAAYTGSAAGLRDFNDQGGLQYTTSSVDIDIDIDDFDTGAGVKGEIYNRRIYDLEGNDITSDVANSISEGATTLPSAVFTVGPGVLAESGDVVGEITSTFTAADGSETSFETGNYYAIVSGENADEIVGVFVLEASGARETSGFIVYREP